MSIIECCLRKTVDMLMKNAVTTNQITDTLFMPFSLRAVESTASEPMT